VRLNGGAKDLPGPQRIIRAAIDWSFALLDRDCQGLLCGLAAFAGGCPAEAVAAVCAPPATASGTAQIDGRLATLVSRNLIGVEVARAATRYTMQETVRGYAAERLAASGAEAGVHRRHVEYFAAFVDEVGRDAVASGQADRYERISRDHHNLRLAFRRAMVRGDTAVAARIALGLERYWCAGRQTGEGREWLHQLLAEPTLPSPLRARLSHTAALLDRLP
jgi:predicted ATPase